MFQAGKIFFMASAMSLAAIPAQAASPERAAELVAKEANPGPRLFNDAVRLEMEKGISKVEQMLGLNNLPPVDESRLPAARLVAATLSQRSSVDEMIDNLYGRVFKAISDDTAKIKPSEISESFGLSEAQAQAVTPAQLDAVIDIMYPQRSERDAKIKAMFQPIVNVVLDKLVPSMQEGQARALARRLTSEQLTDIHQYLRTPTGAAFAQNLLPLNADPELMAAMIRTVPDVLPQIEQHIEPLSRAFESLPIPKSVEDLTDAELRKVATILKTDFKSLKAQVKKQKAETPVAVESPSENYEAYERTNWSKEQLARVEALEAAASQAQDAVLEAQTNAIKDADARLSSGRPPKSAQ